MSIKNFFGIVVAVILAISGSLQAAFRVEDILKQHIRATGGESRISRTYSVVYSSRVEAGHLRGSSTTWIVIPDRVRTDIDLNVIKDVVCFDGENQWTVDANGTLTVGDEMDRRRAFSEAVLAGYQYMFPDSTMRVRFISRQGEFERSFLVLEVTPTRGVPIHVWIDEESGLLAKAEIDPEGYPVAYEYSDHRSVDGLMIPHTIRKTIPQMQQEYYFTVYDAGVNQLVDERLFIMQKPPSQEYRIDGNVARMPFRFEDGLIVISGKISGTGPYDFIIDSGSEFSLVSGAAAARAGLVPVGTFNDAGMDGAVELPLMQIDSINLPQLTLYGQMIGAMDPDELAARYQGRRADFVIGYDLLSAFAPEVRFSDNTVVFHELDVFAAPAGYSFVSCSYQDRIPWVSLFCEDVPGKFIINTTSPAFIDLSDPFVRRSGLKRGRRILDSELHHYVTNARMSVGRMKLVSLGPFEFEGAPVGMAENAVDGILASDDYDGVLGIEFMHRFDFIFDYADNRLALRKTGHYEAPYLVGKSGLRLEPQPDGRILVLEPIPGSPAESAMIEPGSELVQIDGQNARGIGFSGVMEIITGPPRTITVVTTLHGQQRTSSIEMREYY